MLLLPNAPPYVAPLVSGPTLDAIGGASNVINTTGFTATELHPIGSSATAILLAGMYTYPTTGSVAANLSAKCGGVTMSLLASFLWRSESTAFIFGLLDPPTGAQTLAATSASGAGSASIYMNSISYSGVSGFGTGVATGSTSTSTALSQTVTTGALGNLIFQVFVAQGTTPVTIGNYNQTQRWASPVSSYATLIGDAPGAASVAFTAAASASPSVGFGAAAVPLLQ